MANVPGLTIYETLGKPLPLTTSKTAITSIDAILLRSEVCCPICLGFLKKTSIVVSIPPPPPPFFFTNHPPNPKNSLSDGMPPPFLLQLH